MALCGRREKTGSGDVGASVGLRRGSEYRQSCRCDHFSVTIFLGCQHQTLLIARCGQMPKR
jgi:hypothetical protein